MQENLDRFQQQNPNYKVDYEPIAGDYLVVPSLPYAQFLPPADKQRLALVETIPADATPLTWLRTMSVQPLGGYYSFSISSGALPWTTSTAPLDTFSIYCVQQVVRT